MPVDFQEEANGKALSIRLSGKLTKQDYERLVPEVERLIKEHGRIRVLVQMRDFHGWTTGALWEDVKFDLKHIRHIDRLALVGESAWEHGMALFCRPFTTAQIGYFDRAQADKACAWIHDGLSVAETSGARAT